MIRPSEPSGDLPLLRGEPGNFLCFEPLLDAICVTDASELSPRIEQHDHDRIVGNGRVHHEALAGLVDETGFGQADIPAF